MNDGPLITKNSNKIFRNLEIYFSKTFFFLGDDGLIKIWDRRSLKESNPHPVGVFAGHVDGITFIGTTLIMCSKSLLVLGYGLMNHVTYFKLISSQV